jgi:hypothetical protein
MHIRHYILYLLQVLFIPNAQEYRFVVVSNKLSGELGIFCAFGLVG